MTIDHAIESCEKVGVRAVRAVRANNRRKIALDWNWDGDQYSHLTESELRELRAEYDRQWAVVNYYAARIPVRESRA